MNLQRWACVLGVALAAAACAGGPGHDGHLPPGFGDDPDGQGGRPRVQLFISPSGQPFRAPPGQPYPVAKWFAQADANHDGRLTRDEFRADADAWFKVLDANGDGRIDMPEVSHWEDNDVPEITGVGNRIAPSRNTLDTRYQGAAMYSLINEPHPIRGADADFSQSVSRAEWRAATDRRFALLDLDGDGVVALADLRPTPAQYEAQHRREHAKSRGHGGGGHRYRR